MIKEKERRHLRQTAISNNSKWLSRFYKYAEQACHMKLCGVLGALPPTPDAPDMHRGREINGIILLINNIIPLIDL